MKFSQVRMMMTISFLLFLTFVYFRSRNQLGMRQESIEQLRQKHWIFEEPQIVSHPTSSTSSNHLDDMPTTTRSPIPNRTSTTPPTTRPTTPPTTTPTTPPTTPPTTKSTTASEKITQISTKPLDANEVTTINLRPASFSVLDSGAYEHDNPNRRTPDIRLPVNCEKLFSGDTTELNEALKYTKDSERDLDPVYNKKVVDQQFNSVLKRTSKCSEYLKKSKYITGSTSKEEEEFPIAYSILLFRDINQFEKLLRAIYRSQNFICVHLDSKSSQLFRKAVMALINCLPNVFISSRSIDVQWAAFSVLEPELVCMRDLLQRSARWKYFINLTGQEWPLKTNKELVLILKAYNNGNDVEGSVKRSDPMRYNNLFDGQNMLSENIKKPVPVTMVKGSVHIVVQRGFVDYVVNNKIAQDFATWLNGTWASDETFFASLNHSPHLNIPGSYLGEPETDPILKPFLARFKNWGNWPFDYPCKGQWIKQICVFGYGDLKMLSERKELFANKFYENFEPMTLKCMEWRHYEATERDLQGTSKYDISYYASVSFAKFHVN